jgi:hypothetical protein
MSLPSPFGGSRRAVAAQHLRVGPTGDADQVLFLTAGNQPAVGERVPEEMRVEAVNARFTPALADDLPETRTRESSAPT